MIEKLCSLTTLYMIIFFLLFFPLSLLMMWQKCGHSLILLLIFVDENEVVISTSLMLKRSKTRPQVNCIAIKRKTKKHRFDMIIVFWHAWFICLQNVRAPKIDRLIDWLCKRWCSNLLTNISIELSSDIFKVWLEGKKKEQTFVFRPMTADERDV
jgi:hypothetical protein